MIIDSQPHCTLEYIAELRCVLQTWEGFSGSRRFRDSIKKTIAFAQTEEVNAIISDTRGQKLVATEDVKWLSEVANPQLHEAGVCKLAFIVPKEQLLQMGQREYAWQSQDQITIEWFSDLDEAEAWVREEV